MRAPEELKSQRRVDQLPLLGFRVVAAQDVEDHHRGCPGEEQANRVGEEPGADVARGPGDLDRGGVHQDEDPEGEEETGESELLLALHGVHASPSSVSSVFASFSSTSS